MLSEISQTEKVKYWMISLICGIEREREDENENRMVATKG